MAKEDGEFLKRKASSSNNLERNRLGRVCANRKANVAEK